MRFDQGVSIKELTPQLLLAMQVVDHVWTNQFRLYEAEATSLDDGDHGEKGVPDERDPKTYHGKGRAIDIRTKNVPRKKVPVIVNALKARLGHLGFDVVLEDFEGKNEHIHIEWDKRGGKPMPEPKKAAAKKTTSRSAKKE